MNEPNNSQWSVDALKQYMDRRFETMTAAIDTASRALDQRLESMNAFRAQISTERTTYLTKSEYERAHEGLIQREQADITRIETRLVALERWQAKLLGAMALVLIMIPMLTAVAVFYITRHL